MLIIKPDETRNIFLLHLIAQLHYCSLDVTLSSLYSVLYKTHSLAEVWTVLWVLSNVVFKDLWLENKAGQGLEAQRQGQELEVHGRQGFLNWSSRTRTRTWGSKTRTRTWGPWWTRSSKLILEDKDFHRGQQHWVTVKNSLLADIISVSNIWHQ